MSGSPYPIGVAPVDHDESLKARSRQAVVGFDGSWVPTKYFHGEPLLKTRAASTCEVNKASTKSTRQRAGNGFLIRIGVCRGYGTTKYSQLESPEIR